MLRFALVATVVCSMASALPGVARAQSCCGAQPTVAYYAPQAPVYQTYRAYDGWYPGKYLGRLFGWNDYTAVAPATYATTAYRPVYPASYVAAYPAATTAYYPPAYTASYAAAYAPACSACGTDPCGCTAQRPVVLSALSPCDSGCGGCSACAGASDVGYATYDAGCSSCSGAVQSDYEVPVTGNGGSGLPTPAVPEESNVPEDRSIYQRPESAPAGSEDTLDLGSDGSASYFQAPQLFNPRDQTTKRPTAPVWTAVYKKPVDAAPASATSPTPPTRHRQVGASGWRSAASR